MRGIWVLSDGEQGGPRDEPLGRSAPSCTLHETSDPERSAEDTREIDDTLLGEQVVWREWTDHDGVVTRVTIPRGARPAEVVVTCRARDAAELGAVRAIFQSLRVRAQP